MRPYETLGQPPLQRPYEAFGQPPLHLPDDAVHRLAQALESGDPRQVMMRLSAEHQGVQRQHPNNPQAVHAEMHRLTTSANQEAAQYERSYGLRLVQLHPHRNYDGSMVMGVGRFNGSGWEDWNPQANAWMRSDSQQTMGGPYAAPQVDRFAPVSPLLSRPGSTVPYDWGRWNHTPANLDDTAYGDGYGRNPDYAERERARETEAYRERQDAYRDRQLGQAAYRDPDFRYTTGSDPDDRIDRLYAIERRIEQEQLQLQRMMQQLAAQEQWLAQQQQIRPGYTGAYASGYAPYAPNYAGRTAGWEQYHTPDWRHRNPQLAYANQMQQWQQWQQYQQAQQYAQYQQYAPQYTQYQQSAQYQPYPYANTGYVMPPMRQLAMGGHHRGLRIML
ncbi:MAG TPA: hypothetical protein V6D22_14550 [Candidatus Obscuribacterales bacterium]